MSNPNFTCAGMITEADTIPTQENTSLFFIANYNAIMKRSDSIPFCEEGCLPEDIDNIDAYIVRDMDVLTLMTRDDSRFDVSNYPLIDDEAHDFVCENGLFEAFCTYLWGSNFQIGNWDISTILSRCGYENDHEDLIEFAQEIFPEVREIIFDLEKNYNVVGYFIEYYDTDILDFGYELNDFDIEAVNQIIVENIINLVRKHNREHRNGWMRNWHTLPGLHVA